MHAKTEVFLKKKVCCADHRPCSNKILLLCDFYGGPVTHGFEHVSRRRKRCRIGGVPCEKFEALALERSLKNLSMKRSKQRDFYDSNNPRERKIIPVIQEKINAATCRLKKWKPPCNTWTRRKLDDVYFKKNAKVRKRIQKFEENYQETSNYPPLKNKISNRNSAKPQTP